MESTRFFRFAGDRGVGNALWKSAAALKVVFCAGFSWRFHIDRLAFFFLCRSAAREVVDDMVDNRIVYRMQATLYDRRASTKRVCVSGCVCGRGVLHKLRGKDELSQNSKLRTQNTEVSHVG